MSDSQLPEGVSLADLLAELVALRRVVAEQADRIAELERRLGKDSSTSSRPPSSDAPWDKESARKRSSRTRSGRKPGKQKGSPSSSRKLADDPDEVFEVAPQRCAQCYKSLRGDNEATRVRRQVVDVLPPPPPKVTEYQLVSLRCDGCGHVSEPTAADVPRPLDRDEGDPVEDHDGGSSAAGHTTQAASWPPGNRVVPVPVPVLSIRRWRGCCAQEARFVSGRRPRHWPRC